MLAVLGARIVVDDDGLPHRGDGFRVFSLP